MSIVGQYLNGRLTWCHIRLFDFFIRKRRNQMQMTLKLSLSKDVQVTGGIKYERNLQINVPEKMPVRMLNVVIWKHLILRHKVLMATLDRSLRTLSNSSEEIKRT